MSTQGFQGDSPRGDFAARRSTLLAAAERMRRAIDAAAMGTTSYEELDGAAHALVSELRRANEPPEQALLQIKHILAEAGLRPSQGPADPALIVERHVHLYRTVIESSIRHYFGDGSPGSAKSS